MHFPCNSRSERGSLLPGDNRSVEISPQQQCGNNLNFLIKLWQLGEKFCIRVASGTLSSGITRVVSGLQAAGVGLIKEHLGFKIASFTAMPASSPNARSSRTRTEDRLHVHQQLEGENSADLWYVHLT